MLVSKQHLDELCQLRHLIHQHPELSGEESETVLRLLAYMQHYQPDKVITHLGGHSLAFVFEGKSHGPKVLFRAELDGLPIQELNTFDHASIAANVSHKCGHDGHMVMVAGLAALLAENPPERGSVILLFQSAEETGQGAAQVVNAPEFQELQPDYCFALHNLPGQPLGLVSHCVGTFSCASVGFIARFQGRTAHAAEPEHGLSPASAMCDLISGLNQLVHGDKGPNFRLVTVVHAQLGEIAFGTAPADAVVMATLRTETNDGMDQLKADAMQLAKNLAEAQGLKLSISWQDDFPASVNHPDAVALIEKSCERVGIKHCAMATANRWSEDFGHLSATCKGAMFGLGAGEAVPFLHNADYDFPNALLPIGIQLFYSLIEQLCGAEQ